MENQNPFPGMNPWLEQSWGDVHARIVMYAADQLQTRLPPDLRARVEERVFLESPDLHHLTDRRVEIRESGAARRLITVVEVLSPAKKSAGEGRDLYLQNQAELKQTKVNLVEIELLRWGEHVLRVSADRIPSCLRSHYKVCVTRESASGRYEYYPISLREPLPAIAVPLRAGEPDVVLELQPLIEQVYRNGAYDDLDYGSDPSPQLSPDDAAWADQVLRSKGLR